MVVVVLRHMTKSKISSNKVQHFFYSSGRSASDCYHNEALGSKPNCSCLWPSVTQLLQMSPIDLSPALSLDMVYEIQIISSNAWSHARNITIASQWFEIDTAKPTYGKLLAVFRNVCLKCFYFRFAIENIKTLFIDFPCPFTCIF